MNFTIVAVESGKSIRVVDRIASREVFNGFLDPGTPQPVSVASNDGKVGNIDVYKALQGAPNLVHEVDYDVENGEVMNIDD